MYHALSRRHKGEAPFRLLSEQTEIGCRVAYANNAHPPGIRKSPANTPTDKAPRHNTEMHGVKITQVNNVNGHGTKLA